MASRTDIFLTPSELCARWGGIVNEKTLSNWRSVKSRKPGPRYVRIGGRIVYRLEDVLAYESRIPEKRNSHSRDEPLVPVPRSTDISRQSAGSSKQSGDADMTSEEFVAIGEIVYGEKWHKPMARDIERTPKQVRNYATGFSRIPRHIAETVRKLADLGSEGEIIKATILSRLPRASLMIAHVIAREAEAEIRLRRKQG